MIRDCGGNSSPAFYIGALGSGTTTQGGDDYDDAGFNDAQIGRIRGPIGIDINARNPEEIALSILAEIVAIRRALCRHSSTPSL